MTTYDVLKQRAWAGRAEAYAQTFGLLCAHTIHPLLDAVHIRPGVRLLDVGTGTGAVAAAALARGARVTAVDPDPDMRRLAVRAAPGAEVLSGALPALAFDDATFDAVVANFVVNHVGDPLAGVVELARVARPRGWVAVSIWPRPLTELHRLWEDVMEASGVLGPPVATLDPGNDFARTSEGLERLLTRAGLQGVEATTPSFVHAVDPEVWWSGPARGVASIGSVVEAQGPDVATQMKYHYDRISRRYLGADGLLHLPTAAIIGRGRAL
ncbi:MAG TPA: class I SAM-dependent methyltransferase [Dermatophilaceae bacterium]